MTVKINRSRSINKLTTRQRRRKEQLQDDIRKLKKAERKKALLNAKDAKKPIPAYTGVGRDNAAAAGGSSGVGGSYITTDGIFTLVIS